MIDELDDVLAQALHERGRHVGAPVPRPGDVRRRVVRRRRRRIAVPVTAVLVLAVGLVASRALPTRSTTTVTVDAPAAPSSSTAAAAPTPTTAAPVAEATPTTTAAATRAAVPWLGVDDPTWLPRAALDLRSPGYPGGHRFLRYRADGDWRSVPAVDVLDRDRTPGDDMPNGQSTTIAGRQAWIGRYDDGTRVRIELAPNRVAELTGRGVDESVLVAAAASTTLDGGELRLAPPTGLTLLSDATTDGLHTTHRLVYEAFGDATNQRLWVTVTSDPAVATSWIPAGDPVTIAGQPGLAEASGRAWFIAAEGWSAIVQVLGPGASTAALPAGIRLLSADEVDALAVIQLDGSSLDAPYPVTPGMPPKRAAFAAALPAGFADIATQNAGDSMAVSFEVQSDAGQRIWLELVQATDGAPSGSQDAPIVVVDNVNRRVVRWRSPSGWVYELTADGLKAGTAPPLTIEQITAVLQAVEAA